MLVSHWCCVRVLCYVELACAQMCEHRLPSWWSPDNKFIGAHTCVQRIYWLWSAAVECSRWCLSCRRCVVPEENCTKIKATFWTLAISALLFLGLNSAIRKQAKQSVHRWQQHNSRISIYIADIAHTISTGFNILLAVLTTLSAASSSPPELCCRMQRTNAVMINIRYAWRSPSTH